MEIEMEPSMVHREWRYRSFVLSCCQCRPEKFACELQSQFRCGGALCLSYPCTTGKGEF